MEAEPLTRDAERSFRKRDKGQTGWFGAREEYDEDEGGGKFGGKMRQGPEQGTVGVGKACTGSKGMLRISASRTFGKGRPPSRRGKRKEGWLVVIAGDECGPR